MKTIRDSHLDFHLDSHLDFHTGSSSMLLYVKTIRDYEDYQGL